MAMSMKTIAATVVVAACTLVAFAGEGGDLTRRSEDRATTVFATRDITLRLQILDKQYELLAMRQFDAQLSLLDLRVAASDDSPEEVVRERKLHALGEKVAHIEEMMKRNRIEAERLTLELVSQPESAPVSEKGK